MKLELVIATKNKKKLEEIKELLRGLEIKIISLQDLPDAPRIIENGKSFGENARKKALTIARYTNKLTLGEDSGLEVEALKGAPGIYSSRFAGRNKSDLANNLKLLRLLGNLPLKKRKARYRCSVALADKNGVLFSAEASCSGLIGFEMRGRYGFGYDPLFIIPKYKKTFAQLGPRIKHTLSHRYRALKKIQPFIAAYIKRNL